MATTDTQKLEAGKRALTYFFNRSVGKYGGAYANMPFQDFINYIDGLGTGSTRKNLGAGILGSNMPETRVVAAMEEVADAYAGKLPDWKGSGAFLNALLDQQFSISYKMDLLQEGVVEGIKDVGSAATKLAGAGIALYVAGALVILYLASGKARAA